VRPVLTEIYPCHVCSRKESEDGNAPGQHILGHQPPQDTGVATTAGGWSWLPGYWGHYCNLINKHRKIVRGQFFGHIHIDQWTLTRECTQSPPFVSQPPPAAARRRKPLNQPTWTAPSHLLVWLPFVAAQKCTGAATTVLLGGPSLTEGFPATNPNVRLLEFDPSTYELRDAHTYTFDLREANRRAGSGGAPPEWKLAYSFREYFGMPDMGPASFEALAKKLKEGKTQEANSIWEKLRGRGDGAMCVSQRYAQLLATAWYDIGRFRLMAGTM
jgi:hypothetical protein